MHSATSIPSSLGSCDMRHSVDLVMTRTECFHHGKTHLGLQQATSARSCFVVRRIEAIQGHRSLIQHTAGTEQIRPDLMRALRIKRLIGSQSSILVDPFSPLHHQWVAWILSGWSSLQAPPIPFGLLWSGTMSL